MTGLTPVELGILVALADGDSQAEIAAERLVSADVVASVVKSLRGKLGARTAAHAVALGYHRGLLVPQGRGA